MPDRPSRAGAGWAVVVPVKGLGRGKSRLREPGSDRDDLAVAFALDTVEAAVDCAAVIEVLVVTGDPQVAEVVTAAGASVIDEPQRSSDQLNSAIGAGLTAARERHPTANVAVLTSDLPSITAAALADALRRAEAHPLAMVTDAAGVGTTTLTARSGLPIEPSFGEGSRVRHEAAGHVLIPFPARSGMRNDVDSQSDLELALRLGVGRHTAAAVSTVR